MVTALLCSLHSSPWSVGGWGHPWHHGLSWFAIHDLYAEFQLSSMIISESRTHHPWSHTWRTLMVPDWCLGGWGHHWQHGSSWCVILYLCAKFQISSMIRSVPRTPHPWSHTWRTLRFLTKVLEDEVILDIMDHHYLGLFTCLPNFSSLAWLEVCQEPHILEVHSWRMLMVPDWGRVGHPWHHGLSWYAILHLCA